MCDAPTSSLVLQDRAHPEMRKMVFFNVVQVKLKDPEIHDSVACELHGRDLDISVAFAASFENLWRRGKKVKG